MRLGSLKKITPGRFGEVGGETPFSCVPTVFIPGGGSTGGVPGMRSDALGLTMIPGGAGDHASLCRRRSRIETSVDACWQGWLARPPAARMPMPPDAKEGATFSGKSSSGLEE
jgi:hypothetical protein